MLRSIKSGQRKVRILAVKISAAGVVSGLDSKKVSFAGGILSFNESFAEAPVIIANYVSPVAGLALPSGTGDLTPVSTDTITNSQCTISSAPPADIEMLIIGSDTAEKY